MGFNEIQPNMPQVQAPPKTAGKENAEAKIRQLEQKIQQLDREKDKAEQKKDTEKARKIEKQIQQLQRQIEQLRQKENQKAAEEQGVSSSSGKSQREPPAEPGVGNELDETV